jgi:5-dehydro-2-deoxygluconokinase
VGAGDAFLAAFLATRFAGAEMAEAVRRGSASAALVVSRPGCSEAMPRAEEVTAFMQATRMTTPAAVGA